MLDENAPGLVNNIAGSSGEKSRGQFAHIMRRGRMSSGHPFGVITSATGTLAGTRCGVGARLIVRFGADCCHCAIGTQMAASACRYPKHAVPVSANSDQMQLVGPAPKLATPADQTNSRKRT
jgi:hypothetical protein